MDSKEKAYYRLRGLILRFSGGNYKNPNLLSTEERESFLKDLEELRGDSNGKGTTK